jgi:membrane protease YdiL (CAAX protease family)
VNGVSSDVPPVILPPAEPAPVNRGRWWLHLVLIAGYVLVLGALGWQRRETRMPALTSNVSGLLLVCSVELLIFGSVFAIACLLSRPSRNDLLLRWDGKWQPLVWGFGYSLALRLAIAILMVVTSAVLVASGVVTQESVERFAATHQPDVEAIVDPAAMRRDPLYFALMVTLVSFVVAGLREELWRSGFLAGLRKLWPQRFGSRAGQIAGAAVAAVVFGVGHLGMGVLAAVLTALLGFGLGVIMVLHKSIWPAVIAHGLFDATSFALIPFALEELQKIQRSLGQ